MSVVLKAEKRESFGSSATKVINRAGRIPAVIYVQGSENTHLSIDTKEFEHEYFKGIALTSVVELELGGKKIKVIAHKVELDPVSDRPIHVDFLPCEADQAIRAKPKIVFIEKEKSPGLKKGGFLHVVLRRVEVLCDSEKSIPDQLEIDASKLHVGYKIRAEQIILPAGVKLAKKSNFLVASIIGRGKSEEAADGAEAGDAAGKAEDKKEEDKK